MSLYSAIVGSTPHAKELTYMTGLRRRDFFRWRDAVPFVYTLPNGQDKHMIGVLARLGGENFFKEETAKAIELITSQPNFVTCLPELSDSTYVYYLFDPWPNNDKVEEIRDELIIDGYPPPADKLKAMGLLGSMIDGKMSFPHWMDKDKALRFTKKLKDALSDFMSSTSSEMAAMAAVVDDEMDGVRLITKSKAVWVQEGD